MKIALNRCWLFKFLALWVGLVSLQGCIPVIATGVVGGGMVAVDRRSAGAELDDQAIEFTAFQNIDSKYHDRVHVEVNSYNRQLLLTGEVPDETTRQHVGALAQKVNNVLKVVNDVVVAPNIDYARHIDDAYISTDVRAHFISDAKGRFYPIHVTVTTENGVVYLMGLMTHAEADAAIEIASKVNNVKRVVPVFEYIADPNAPQKPDTVAPATSTPPAASPSSPPPSGELPAGTPVQM